MIVGIVKYGVGNIGSIVNAFKKLGIETLIVESCDKLNDCDVVILPGVGSFDAAMSYIKSRLPCIIDLKGSKPILGICLGLQIMFECSDEGTSKGLSWYSGRVRLLKSRVIPHMGWNSVKIIRKTDLTKDLPEEPYFYFAHSYCIYSNDVDESIKLGITTFEDSEFLSILFDEKNLILGTQFHPERSSKNGLKLLKNFIDLCRR